MQIRFLVIGYLIYDLLPVLQSLGGNPYGGRDRESSRAQQDALKSARGNRAKAARLLQSTSRVVNYKIRKYRIDWRRFQ